MRTCVFVDEADAGVVSDSVCVCVTQCMQHTERSLSLIYAVQGNVARAG